MKEILEKVDRLNREVVQLVGQGDFERATKIAREAVKIGRKNLSRYPIFADSLNNLAELYRMQGYFLEAKPLYIEALNLRKELLGDFHPDIAQALNNIAAFYVSQGLYSQAENYLFAALDIFKYHLGDEHEQIANYLNNIAEVYREQGRLRDAEKMHLQALDMRKRLLGDSHADIAQSLDNLAVVYENQARYLEAEKTHLQALEIRQKLFGNENWQIAATLNNLAALYNSQGRFSEAEKNYSQALKLCKNCFENEEHPYIAITLNNLANTFKNQGDYQKAEKLHLQALSIRKNIFGDEHLEVAQSLSNLGNIYLVQGNYLDAEQVYLQADSIRKNLLNSEHPDIALSLHNLAVLYTYQGRYRLAEVKYLEALSINERALGQNHPVVADNLNHLGSVYQEQGLFSDAEQKYLAALAIRKNIFGEEHPDIADSFNKIAEIYRLQGRYPQAEGLYIAAYKLNKKLLGEMHPDIAGIVSNLGVLYDAQFKYSQAEPLFIEALLVVKNKFGNNHPQVASVMNNLAAIYGSMGRYLEAETMHLQVLELRKNILRENNLGEEHPDIANTLNNLGEVYFAQGKYGEAEKYYSSALSLRVKLLGENHPDVALSLNNLATLYAATQRPDQALSYRIQASEIHDRLISNVFGFSSENERLAFIDKIRNNFDLFLSLIYKYLSNSPTAIQQAFDFILKRKGLTAASLTAQNQAFYSDRYPQLTEKFRQLNELSNQIIHLTFLGDRGATSLKYRSQNLNYYPINYSQTNLIQLQSQYDNLQKQIATQVPEIQLSQQIPNRHAVASALPANSVLIEFVHFDVFDFQAIPANKETQWQPHRYLAFIVPAGKPNAVEMVDLGEAAQINELIGKFRLQASDSSLQIKQQTLAWGKSKSSNPHQQIAKIYPSDAIELSKLILAPILEKITKNQHLILATDGNLNLMPLQILPIDKTGKQLLMDEYKVSYLGVGRDILHSQVETTKIAADIPIIIADPDFDLIDESRNEDSRETIQISQNFSPTNTQPKQTRDREFIDTLTKNWQENQNLSRAVGTRLLGESIAKKIKKSKLYTGTEALETRLTDGKCPQIMLIATHGLFIPDTEQISNPMMRSAIALAGANTWLSGGKLPENAGKGIIFAQDIAGLDLRGNQLTVLSACDTARGDIKIGEGVFGLRRAFTTAGSKALIMSLWKVPDRATALLMERFFDNYQDGMEPIEALQNAQDYIRNIAIAQLRESALGMEILAELAKVRGLKIESCNDREKPLAHPFYWGAWICQGF